MGLVRCLMYMAAWGAACFPLGRMLKRLGLRWDRPPFACKPWEKGGAIYEKFGIRRWKDIVPDVSKVFSKIVPRKAVIGRPGADTLRDMLAETCVAELTHLILCAASPALLFLWPGWGGAALFAAYVLVGNLPFIMIQRYNRPRFGRLLEAAERRERRLADAATDTVEQ